MHPLKAVAEREQVGRDRPEVVPLKERVDLVRVQRICGLGRNRTGDV
jgi:hypothetical protein